MNKVYIVQVEPDWDRHVSVRFISESPAKCFKFIKWSLKNFDWIDKEAYKVISCTLDEYESHSGLAYES